MLVLRVRVEEEAEGGIKGLLKTANKPAFYTKFADSSIPSLLLNGECQLPKLPEFPALTPEGGDGVP